ncbi:MAG TPA: ATP12 family protein [Caulobacteraceae bacterium]|jgi:chaperone required for assembly of F1-ATPase
MFTRAKAEPLERPKRFYKTAAAAPVEGGWGVTLDGRALRTPQRKSLVLPSQALAELVASEWDSQGAEIVIPDMHATRLAFTALDVLGGAREAVADEVAKYAASDLLCYFAEGPLALVERQARAWGPVLDWAEAEFGLVLDRTSGVVHRPQPPQTLEAVRALALRLDDFELAGLAQAAGLFGSAVLALALQRARLGGQEAFALSRLDEAFQEEQWGVDDLAAERTARLGTEAQALEGWFAALRG